MIDKERLQNILAAYKDNFDESYWEKENFKWEAVQVFQDNWDVNAADFATMLSLSLSKTFNLLTSSNNFPANMIQEFAVADPEAVRAMFIALFDESVDVVSRILAFKDQAAVLLKKYGKEAKSHFQRENPISTYLWLRYPDKYYIYKYSEIKAVAEELDNNCRIKRGAYVKNLRNFFNLYDELCAEIKKDKELVGMLKSHLTESCYPDPECRTLTIDVGFYISRYYSQEPVVDDDWFPADYSPNITVEEWVDLLNDPVIFTTGSLEIMKRMKDYGGQATCTQLSVKYGETANFYNGNSSALARRVAAKTGCPIMDRDEESFRWWPILYVGRSADKNDPGSYIWKLRDELAEALDKVDLSQVELYAVTSSSEEEHQGYWWVTASPKIWSFSEHPVGGVQAYSLYNDNGNKRRVFQNFLDAKTGDKIIGYESHPVKQIVALGEISSEQDGEKIYFEKNEGLASPIDYQTLKSFPELEKMEFFSNPQGSLFALTKDEYDFLLDLIRDENPIGQDVAAEKYSKSEFLDEVYMTESDYKTMIAVLKNKKNIILQGAPGVGKTFAAKRLAYSIIGKKDENRIEFVQFHQNYTYEDFVMGYKPVEDGFKLEHGVFYKFCLEAKNHPDEEFFFIIDEINRGNMSKIFGELLMLIERDYRDTKITLAYDGLTFSVPENIHIIGMMNTADRSLAMIDYALRRRFSFFEMEPGFRSDGFKKYQKGLNNETFDQLVIKVEELNKEITLDKSLGKGFCIGHSYFCGKTICTDEWLHSIVKFDILPMLKEYWFDDSAKLQRWENILLGVLQ